MNRKKMQNLRIFFEDKKVNTIVNNHKNGQSTWFRRQQQKCGGVFWVCTEDGESIGSFKSDDGLQINAKNYYNFLNKSVFEWYKSQPKTFKLKYIFLQHLPQITSFTFWKNDYCPSCQKKKKTSKSTNYLNDLHSPALQILIQ